MTQNVTQEVTDARCETRTMEAIEAVLRAEFRGLAHCIRRIADASPDARGAALAIRWDGTHGPRADAARDAVRTLVLSELRMRAIEAGEDSPDTDFGTGVAVGSIVWVRDGSRAAVQSVSDWTVRVHDCDDGRTRVLSVIDVRADVRANPEKRWCVQIESEPGHWTTDAAFPTRATAAAHREGLVSRGAPPRRVRVHCYS